MFTPQSLNDAYNSSLNQIEPTQSNRVNLIASIESNTAH